MIKLLENRMKEKLNDLINNLKLVENHSQRFKFFVKSKESYNLALECGVNERDISLLPKSISDYELSGDIYIVPCEENRPVKIIT